ncbi:MAG: RsmE family RNA methyltransferase [Candidatus Aureabacteria bacterium]|nr:RsmE family RNA methyltransferase [Candidatus Auribacterota bacterium]
MHLRRVFIDQEIPAGDTLAIRDSEAHYLQRVLRLGKGEEVTLFNGRGLSCTAVITKIVKGAVELKVGPCRRAGKSVRGFAVATALLKAPAMDMVVQRCTELGAFALLVFETGHSIPRSRGSASTGARLNRWKRIAIAACRQCGRDFLPEIAAVPGIGALADCFRNYDVALVASLCEGSSPLLELLNSEQVKGCRRILLIVGPEGDFSPEELHRLIGSGAIPCTLSDAVLRADTAAVSGAALMSGHFLTNAARATS